MTLQTTPIAALRAELERVAGVQMAEEVALASLTTFRIGGAAELLVDVGRERALCRLLASVERHAAPFFLLGIGSNVLLPDEGLRGVVARLGGELKRMRFEEETVEAGGALPLPKLARAATARGLLGLEALSGFPSTVGGAVCMNAGCYGTEIIDVLESVRAVDRGGRAETMAAADLGAGYRSTRLQQSGHIVASARFRLRAGDAAAAREEMERLNRKRWRSLPTGDPNVGSIFRNPEGHAAGRLIDDCGLKGLEIGGARISPKHGNVIVNTGRARAADVLALMAVAHRAVVERFGISLVPEVVLAGPLRARWEEMVGGAGGAVTESTVEPDDRQ